MNLQRSGEFFRTRQFHSRARHTRRVYIHTRRPFSYLSITARVYIREHRRNIDATFSDVTRSNRQTHVRKRILSIRSTEHVTFFFYDDRSHRRRNDDSVRCVAQLSDQRQNPLLSSIAADLRVYATTAKDYGGTTTRRCRCVDCFIKFCATRKRFSNDAMARGANRL